MLLDIPPAEKSEVLRELQSHMADIWDELVASGTPASKVEIETERRMGSPQDVAFRINAAHNIASWKSVLLTVLPFLAAFLLLFLQKTHQHWIWPLAATCVITSVVSIRELIRGRRPIWLSSWLAIAMATAVSLVYQVVKYPANPSVIVELKAAVISGLGLSVIFLTSAIAVRKWQLAAGILCGIYLICAFAVLRNGSTGTANFMAIVTGMITQLVMLVIFARIIFELHAYGNAIRASLFLLSLAGFAYLTYIKPWQFGSTAVDILLAAVTAVWVARARNRNLKVRALTIGVFLMAVVGALFDQNLMNKERYFILIIMSLVFSTITSFFFSSLFILIPVWCENWGKQADTPLAIE
ncbi:MAG: hypothetical protein ABFD64_08700 [Armatimonadota bacterium]